LRALSVRMQLWPDWVVTSKTVDGITRRHGHYLPHWTADGATYFVTFRLGDSMPREVVERFAAEHGRLVAAEERLLSRKLTAAETSKEKGNLRNQIEKYLDSGYGRCELGRPECAVVVRDTLAYFDLERYNLGAWVVMPNHVHVIVKPTPGYELEKIVRSWKRFTAHQINKLVGRSGRLWQSEPFDHMIRSHEHLLRFSRYVLDNPAQAGLADWEWVGIGSLGTGEPPETST
jgi:REP element-mobilizing transposase RayT